VEDIGNVLAFVSDLERFAVVAAPVASFACHIHWWQKVHLDLEQTVALAFLAPAAFHIETESSGFIAPNSRGGKAREQIANGIKHPGIGRRVAPRGASDWRLVNDDDLIEVFEPFQSAMSAGTLFRTEEFAKQRPAKDVVHEGAFARAADSRNTRQRPE